MSLDFIFSRGPALNGDLVFVPPGTELDVDASVTGSFAPLTAEIVVSGVVEVTITGSFAGLSATASVAYSSNTNRPVVGSTTSDFQQAVKSEYGYAHGQQDAPAAPVGWESFWERTTARLEGIEHVLPGNLARARINVSAGYQEAAPMRDERGFKHQDATSLKRDTQSSFERGTGMRDDTLFKHQDGDRLKRPDRASKWQVATPLNRALGTAFDVATPFIKGWGSEYQEGAPPPPGISLIPTPPGPEIGCYTPSPNLLFSWPAGYGKHFIFVCGDYEPPPPPPEGEVIVPVRKVYFMANNLALYRVSDNALVPALSVSLSLDVDSWSWGFSAQLPGAAQSLVEPVSGPVELRVSLNGTDFRVIAESVARERVFGQTTIRVSGRGRNAALDAPYAAQQVFSGYGALTANQLMEQVLTLNGIPLGWGITFELDDWNVPAGVFNHQGTYITALKAIAEAAGGYLLPHASNQSFTVKHLYPTLPWDWGTVTPNYTLPADVVTRESLEWVEKPSYNRVYVSGQDQGRLGRVTRSGTAGDVLAPMVVDQLITSVVASRQRGEAILADTGKQIKVGLRLPVLTETGVIRPGHFVQYVDGGTTRTGLVRGVSVDSDGVEAWQRLEVETHG